MTTTTLSFKVRLPHPWDEPPGGFDESTLSARMTFLVDEVERRSPKMKRFIPKLRKAIAAYDADAITFADAETTEGIGLLYGLLLMMEHDEIRLRPKACA